MAGGRFEGEKSCAEVFFEVVFVGGIYNMKVFMVFYYTLPYLIFNPYRSNHLARMVMEPKYLAQEVIGHPNHPLCKVSQDP